ncbi:MAG: phospholipid carrier-dependent glycosyltransferase [Acidobacteria bacterium]|nr:MAG: phospholipid carrier-dependent glycosyltransferase [Acidobacteriota bacterium]REJ99071.1 MAG: phospholipid carrier-dependent glycosyltransferase [Acidobacteriota bacterium]REK16209.1 MAG: phospholipid carrier-dependent glycosyltransferase [Acidobacteriota bacterium]REK43890.1 MAG: phospholipid carrier-dependent glycosyltransferase [Acidobacteriota bacterium]
MYLKPLIFLNILIMIAYAVIAFPDGVVALLPIIIVSGVVIFFANRFEREESNILIQVFLIALAARLTLGLLVDVFDLRGFFGGDANTYNRIASKIVDVWTGVSGSEILESRDLNRMAGGSRGMYYLTATLYLFFGKNILAAQAFCGTVGAATAPVVYRCAKLLYSNRRVAIIAAYFVALFPAMIVWSSQLLKDGLIVFLLAFSMLMIIRLQKKFSTVDILLLCVAMLGVVTFRFYIFYMLAAAVVGAFIVGSGGTKQSLTVRLAALLMIGLGLTYLGVLRSAGRGLERIDSLQTVQTSRAGLARDEAGFGEDIDVSTTEGAISAIPIGLTYLLLAPFPWQVATLRQTVVLPDVLIWWSSLFFLVVGVIYSIRHKFKETVPIFLFTGMLSFAYSIFQGNVGTAYRQRTQIQVFLFIFIAVGITVFLERRENKKALREARRREMDRNFRERERLRVEGVGS